VEGNIALHSSILFEPKIQLFRDCVHDGILRDPHIAFASRFRVTNNDGEKMERSRLRAMAGMRYAMLNPILEELVREGRINISHGKDRDMVSLMSQ
jgi:hypothetical protein